MSVAIEIQQLGEKNSICSSENRSEGRKKRESAKYSEKTIEAD